MKLFIFLVILSAFMQTSFVPLNLCLILIISRSYALPTKSNYYLALFGGLLVGLLSVYNLGFYPLIFLSAVFCIQIIRGLPFTNHFFTVIPVSFLILSITLWSENFFLNIPVNYWSGLIGSLLCLPIFLVIRQFEDSFVVKKGIKLKV